MLCTNFTSSFARHRVFGLLLDKVLKGSKIAPGEGGGRENNFHDLLDGYAILTS